MESEDMKYEDMLRPVQHQLDTAGTVYIAKNVVYRKISPDYKEAALRLFNSGLFKELVARRLFPKTQVNQEALARGELVLEHERAPFLLNAWEWSFSMLKDAALTILSVAELCEKNGYHMQDSHVFNVMFFSGRPMFVDFGSIREGAVPGGLPQKEFFRYAYVPLQLWSKGDFYLATRLLQDNVPMRLQPFVQVDQTPFFQRHAQPFIRRHDVGFALKTLANMVLWQIPGTRKHLLDVSDYGKFRFGVREMSERIRTLLPPSGKTEWKTYHDSHFQSDSVTPRFRRIVEILAKYEWKKAVDVAGNGGYVTELLVRHFPGALFLCLDYDSQAVDQAYRRFGESEELVRRATVGMVNVMHPEGTSLRLEDRIKSDLVLALAVTHHLILRQKANIDLILKSFCEATNQYLAIEFMPLGLFSEQSSQPPKPVPSWYCPEWFKGHLESHVRILLEEQLEPNRIFYLCEKRPALEKSGSL